MTQNYTNDVFVSYRHQGAVLKWVKNYFHELLEDWLPNYLDYQPKIFIDWQIETGSEWPSALRRELKLSRCLLAIWSPVYFTSAWCNAEFESFRDREKLLGLRTEHNPSGLIYGILFASPQLLPPQVQTIEHKDLSKWANTSPAFKQSLAHVEFENSVKKVCEELAKIISSAPGWQDNWPVKTPNSPPDAPFGQPRIL
jgi:TIR domain